MDGRGHKAEQEKPIAKPSFPLPIIFDPTRRSELPTRRRTNRAAVQERARFYRKDVGANGRPVYGFQITVDTADQDTSNKLNFAVPTDLAR